MLNKVLEFIIQKGDFSTAAISKELNISEPMIEDIKDRLIKMGYIEKIECDTEVCEKCSCGCGKVKRLKNRTTNWKVTEKGNKLMNRAGGRL